ncbi:hypothetical protein G6F57_006837 [Rhizopus arrhizus]|uniref:Nudix hydrolase domain-containing protein n=1 Tax=Rhizopus oryzae TaxID=64495 RepID=A0A9P6X3Y7_RHIOR|nr:hypothetical protein G6F23_003557 [Rhizopus arrhizus]KAG1418729.1 hypothetical protein G6F58_004940 [Rhizopus delemar]KAG0760538.1 hypothetical protein G6F24_008240 [Rhizopus arrhizus]KAG0786723.1 hypothetical protein G6F21_008393 [Rhizopus arrhizus]KAG0809115.1 hypothetical protein G6F20_009031 [Rhizopus arrhizus]
MSLLRKKLVSVKTLKPAYSLGKGDWLELERIEFKDDRNIQRSWERCIRKKSQTSKIDAVDIHAIILTPEPELLLSHAALCRPAIECYCIEFPSGLVDANDDDPITSAQRELKEETGYTVPKEKITLVNSPLPYEPGLTDSCCYVVKTVIDAKDILSSSVIPEPEADEWSLQTLSLPLKGLLEYLLELEKSNEGQLMIDSRVYSLASGLAYSSEFYK